jgi:arylsulfatase A
MAATNAENFPNIIYILTDDLGYGDLGCYNPESRIPTPNLDKMASNGVRFTDAHASDAVCSPSRYSILTGSYCWRTPLKAGTTATFAGPLITSGRLTVAQLLKDAGYSTACIGKWHVGMSWTRKTGEVIMDPNDPLEDAHEVDLSAPIQNGPTTVGFDYFYGAVACPTSAPLYAFIENDTVLGQPDIEFPGVKDWLVNQRAGLLSEEFDFQNMDLIFLEKSQQWVAEQRERTPDRPFFLYHAMQAPHCPVLPASQFQGSTSAGPYGDFVAEVDWIVGELLKLADVDDGRETLFVFTSDNGPETHAIRRKRETGHDSAFSLRGLKRDNWEGGHRVPFIVQWYGKAPRGATCTEPICLSDLTATCAEIIGSTVPSGNAEDSHSILKSFTGQSYPVPLRPAIVHNAFTGVHGIRSGSWKLLDHQGAGSHNYRDRPIEPPVSDPDAPGQLYNLEDDLREDKNLFRSRPETVAELEILLRQSESPQPTAEKDR